jgi:homocitrate synthase NifV
MAGIGVGKIKMSTSKVSSPSTLAGMDRALFSDFSLLFKALRDLELPEVHFGNRYGCATALAAAWLESGGRGVLASFGGTGGFPAIEELRLMLHTSGKLPLVRGKGNLAEISSIFEYFSGKKIRGDKPVTGWAIFAVESGIHVDGLLKDPELYEPFPPELVGGRRYHSVGLHSGRNSLKLKCGTLGLNFDEELLFELVRTVRKLSLELERGLTDGEFIELYEFLEKKRLSG